MAKFLLFYALLCNYAVLGRESLCTSRSHAVPPGELLVGEMDVAPRLGSQNIPADCHDADCNDQDWCTEDFCDVNGVCQFRLVDCDDGDPCTEDTCRSRDGVCMHRIIPNCPLPTTSIVNIVMDLFWQREEDSP